MVARKGLVFMAAAVLGLAAQPAHAQGVQPGLSKTLVKCEDGTGKTLSKFVGSKSKCINKCIATARKTMGPFAGCFTPYADPTANACIMGSLKGAEAKAGAAIAKVCAAASSCPMCYQNNPPGVTRCTDASGGNPWVQSTESLLDPFTMAIWCTEKGGGTPSKSDAKCEDGVSKALAKFVGSKTKCYQKCNDGIAKGKIPAGSCNPPTPGDPAANACVLGPKGAEAKAAASIDKACFTAPATAPACFGALNSGTAWVGIVESAQDTQIPQVGCGSPSGAFLE